MECKNRVMMQGVGTGIAGTAPLTRLGPAYTDKDAGLISNVKFGVIQLIGTCLESGTTCLSVTFG